VELRSANKRLIGWDALIEPAAYYAGAYEATHQLCGHAVRKAVPAGIQIAQASAQRAITWLERTVAPILVQINRAMDEDTDWLQGIVIDNHQRPVPRSRRGFSPLAMYDGLRQSLDKFIPRHPHPPEPARAAT